LGKADYLEPGYAQLFSKEYYTFQGQRRVSYPKAGKGEFASMNRADLQNLAEERLGDGELLLTKAGMVPHITSSDMLWSAVSKPA